MKPPYLETDKVITRFSSFCTPAIAQYFFELREYADIYKLVDIYAFSLQENLPIIFIGGGTNVIFAFDFFNGIVIRNTMKGFLIDEKLTKVRSGELTSMISLQISKRKINSVFQKWIGLPGTIGGAVAGNAGCFGLETSNVLLSVQYLNMQTGELLDLKNEQLEFSYRNSLLKSHPNWFIVEAQFDITPLLEDSLVNYSALRAAKQPSGYTCGSFFKNPISLSTGRLIDELGMKGLRIGGAEISKVHGNFFLYHSSGGGYQDILDLRDIVKSKVRISYGIELEDEVRIIWNSTKREENQ